MIIVKKNLRKIVPLLLIVSGTAMARTVPPRHNVFTNDDKEQIYALFMRQADAATTHNLQAFSDVLADPAKGQPDGVALIARQYRFWGKPAVLGRFEEAFKGAWRFVPDPAQIRITAINAETAQIYAPTQITVGASDADAKTLPFLMVEVAVRTPAGWRINTIVPVPAT